MPCSPCLLGTALTKRDSRIEMLASELRLLDSASSSCQLGRRKRKEKRKKRLPRTCGRARHRQRQWHAPCWYSVFPSYVGRPKLPGTIVGMVPDDSLLRSSSTLAVASAGLVVLVLLLALCSLLSLTGPRCS